MANLKFQNALARIPQACPPVWMMRQAGRYHRHYQKLRAKNSFMELCKNPELAAQVALGPIQDFDFDVAILFSDLLFPLEALGMGLEYGDSGPKLGWHLDPKSIKNLGNIEEAFEKLQFQKQAMKLTREALPKDKSLIGFVGGPWTLFCYAAQGKHEGGLAVAKSLQSLFGEFCEKMVPLLIKNIQLQFEGGAETVMIFDTAAGELAPEVFSSLVVPELLKLPRAHQNKLGYYSKGTHATHLNESLKNALWAGFGVDHHWDLTKNFSFFKKGFLQGNFDQNFLKNLAPGEFRNQLLKYLRPFEDLTPESRAGWVSGLGHGVLPQTPEENVKAFVETVREVFS